MPSSSRDGSDTTSIGKILLGTVLQDAQYVLDEGQVAAGYAITAVSYPTSDVEILTHQEENFYIAYP